MAILIAYATGISQNPPASKSGQKTSANEKNAAPSGKVDLSQLPPPPANYEWKVLDEINAAFLVPQKWYFIKESKGDQIAYFFTKENIETQGSFKTGLSLNVIKDVDDKIGLSAPAYAKNFIYELIIATDTISTWVNQISSLHQYGCQSHIVVEDSISIVVHNLAIGNKTTNTLYLLTFESPEAEWEKARKIAEITLGSFALDDEI
jgi:hypothetical protein